MVPTLPRRTILTDRQRSALFDLPVDEPSRRKHYTLADDDLQHIGQRRRGENRLGFALQLCALRHPGRALQPGELIPSAVVEFIGAQLGVAVEALLPYAARRQTRQEHLAALRSIYGYRAFAGRGARHLKDWLDGQAEEARSNAELARRLVEECRRRQIILPAVSTLERLCANAAVAADRSVEERIADRLDAAARTALDGLLSETLETRVTRFVWLRQFEPGNNAAVAGRLLDRGEFLQRLGLSERIIEDLPSHRVTRLRRQGERHFADGLREMLDRRRLAILAVCAVEWQAGVADTLIETHDRIVGRIWREAAKLCGARIDDAKTAVYRTLRSFADLGGALLEARHPPAALEQAVSGKLGWDGLSDLVAVATRLTDTMSGNPLAHVAQGHGRLRRYAPRACCGRLISRRSRLRRPYWRPPSGSATAAATAAREAFCAQRPSGTAISTRSPRATKGCGRLPSCPICATASGPATCGYSVPGVMAIRHRPWSRCRSPRAMSDWPCRRMPGIGLTTGEHG